MIQSHQMENGRVKVPEMDFPLDALRTRLIRFAVNVTRLHASTRQPKGERPRVVPRRILAVTWGQSRAPELAPPHHQGVLQHPSLSQII